MRDPQVTRITGPRNLNPELVNEIDRKISEIERVYPVRIPLAHLANREDERWKYHNGHNDNCNGCTTFEAGYGSRDTCKTCERD